MKTMVTPVNSESLVAGDYIPDDAFWNKLQDEQSAWRTRNFGPVVPHQPLLGIFEELGELVRERDAGDVDAILDAVGDTTIYAADYCSGMGWRIADIWVMEGKPVELTRFAFMKGEYFKDAILGIIECFSHHHLKAEQGIRRSREEHELRLRTLVWVVLYICGRECAPYRPYRVAVEATWAKVSQRDWVNHPKDAPDHV